MQLSEIMKRLKANSNLDDIAMMARFGITPDKTFGTKMPVLKAIAREIGKNHELAQKLWDKGYRETRIIASMIEDPVQVTDEQMNKWASDFTYWEICDQTVMNLFGRLDTAWDKAVEWSSSKHEGTKRAAFVLMARLAVHEKKADDDKFERFLPLIVREADDEKNDVKKAVNWALRQIGKRNPALNEKAIKTAEKIRKLNSKSAKWIAADAIKELTGDKVQKRIKQK